MSLQKVKRRMAYKIAEMLELEFADLQNSHCSWNQDVAVSIISMFIPDTYVEIEEEWENLRNKRDKYLKNVKQVSTISELKKVLGCEKDEPIIQVLKLVIETINNLRRDTSCISSESNDYYSSGMI